MHVDGFRFDLASTLARSLHEVDQLSSFFTIIHQDPILSQVKLIAEPWDVGEGGYQVGNFPVRWAEWNGKYRDVMRAFWQGDGGLAGELGYRLSGSSDLYENDGRRPYSSINFIIAHDGFTLRDLVSLQREAQRGERRGQPRRRRTTTPRGTAAPKGPTNDPDIRTPPRAPAAQPHGHAAPLAGHADDLRRRRDRPHAERATTTPTARTTRPAGTTGQLDDERKALLEFTARLIRIRAKHPALRRAKFFKGPHDPRRRRRDIMWFRHDGKRMTRRGLDEPVHASLGMFLARARPRRRRRERFSADRRRSLARHQRRPRVARLFDACRSGRAEDWELLRRHERRRRGRARGRRWGHLARGAVVEALSTRGFRPAAHVGVKDGNEHGQAAECRSGAAPARRRRGVRGGTHFRVWAPRRTRVDVVVEGGVTRALDAESGGYFSGLVEGVGAGARYRYRLDETARSPTRRRAFSPRGRTAPRRSSTPARSAGGRALEGHRSPRGQVLYEMHVGTFTPEGTWAAADREAREAARRRHHDRDDAGRRFRRATSAGATTASTSSRRRASTARPDDLRAFVDRAHALGIGGHPRRRLQPPRPRRELPDAVLRTRTSPTATRPSGARRSTSTARASAGCASSSSQRRLLDRRIPLRRAAARRDPGHLRQLDADHVVADIGAASARRRGRRGTIVVAENEPQHTNLLRPLERGRLRSRRAVERRLPPLAPSSR